MLDKYIIYLAASLFILFSSCSKNDEKFNDKEETIEEEADTNLTPPEKFSTSILDDFLDSTEDDELAYYLEEEFYKNYSAGFKGASILPISSGFWLITLDEPGQKNFLLQKFVNMKTDDIYFKLTETGLKPEDVIGKPIPQSKKE